MQYGVLRCLFGAAYRGAHLYFKMLVDQQEALRAGEQRTGCERNARILQEKIDNYMEEDREKIMKLMEDILRVLSKVDNKL